MKSTNDNSFIYSSSGKDFSKFIKNLSQNSDDPEEYENKQKMNPLYDYTTHTLLKNLYMFGYNSDNIGYILHEPQNQFLIGVDFGEFEKSLAIVEKLEKELNSTLKYIFTTHIHWDHSGGNKAWKDYRGENITITSGNTKEELIPYTDKYLEDLETMTIGEICIACMHIPGHTKSHVCYVVTHVTENSTKIPFLFCGDTLFIGGCGRVFNGTHEELFNSLQLISYLPNDTLIFCGHEYTKKNLEFCLKLDPNNDFLKEKYEWVIKMRNKNEFTVGSRLVEEKLYNPFLRCGDDYYHNLTEQSESLNCFKIIRKLKDEFK